MSNQSKTDSMIAASDKLNAWYFGKLKGLSKFFIKIIPIFIGYGFLSWVFLSIYENLGFEKTLLILLVGVFWYGIRRTD